MQLSPELMAGLERMFSQHAHDAITLFAITPDTFPRSSPGPKYWSLIKDIYPAAAVDTLAGHYTRVEEQLPTHLLHLPLSVTTSMEQGMSHLPPMPHLREEVTGQILDAVWHRRYEVLRPFPGSAQEAIALARHIDTELGATPPVRIEQHRLTPTCASAPSSMPHWRCYGAKRNRSPPTGPVASKKIMS